MSACWHMCPGLARFSSTEHVSFGPQPSLSPLCCTTATYKTLTHITTNDYTFMSYPNRNQIATFTLLRAAWSHLATRTSTAHIFRKQQHYRVLSTRAKRRNCPQPFPYNTIYSATQPPCKTAPNTPPTHFRSDTLSHGTLTSCFCKTVGKIPLQTKKHNAHFSSWRGPNLADHPDVPHPVHTQSTYHKRSFQWVAEGWQVLPAFKTSYQDEENDACHVALDIMK